MRTRDPRRKGFTRAATTGSSTLPSSASRCGRCATGEPPDDAEAAVGDGAPASAAGDAAESADGLQMAVRSMLESLSNRKRNKSRLHGVSCPPVDSNNRTVSTGMSAAWTMSLTGRRTL